MFVFGSNKNMRSRSTRLFVILLHLVGVSRNLPHGPSLWNVGIIGVHPQTIIVERLDLSRLTRGLEGLVDNLAPDRPDADILEALYWFQDDTDGMCLSPTGHFAACGDATLWRLIRRPISKNDDSRERAKDEADISKSSWVYALQSMHDMDVFKYASSASASGAAPLRYDMESSVVPKRADTRTKKPFSRFFRRETPKVRKSVSEECLIANTDSSLRSKRQGRDRVDKNDASMTDLPLRLGSCDDPLSFQWQLDERGVLRQSHYRQHPRRKGGSLQTNFLGNLLLEGLPSPFLSDAGIFDIRERRDLGAGGDCDRCLWREGGSTGTTLAPCGERLEGIEAPTNKPDRAITQFSLLRYQAAVRGDSPVLKSSSAATTLGNHESVAFRESNRQGEPSPDLVGVAPDVVENSSAGHLMTEHHPSGMVAPVRSAPPKTREENHMRPSVTSSMSHGANVMGSPRTSKHRTHHNPLTPLSTKDTASILQESTPMLVASRLRDRTRTSKPQPSRDGKKPQKKLHLDAMDAQRLNARSQLGKKLRKIPTHPYIEASTNGVWVDPQTGLEFPTDLHKYLGHERKRSGRHTLVGVGQYTRTMLKIKVYGVALYVPKRDVLSDPAFSQFASLDVEPLRQNERFYEYLMSDPIEGCAVDRTLFIKLNMQLGLETMRSSLQADWKMLTEEHKSLLINTSFKPRPAETKMLEFIKSKENSSNCSCGQFAPEEYHADPSCCARGTELAFTWRKNGDFELRLDGRLMETFPRPDLAKGIFYEYLRFDDPISIDARDHFADGFPFLLAPLAQVPGVSVGHRAAGGSPEVVEQKRSVNILPFLKGFATDRANEAVSMVQGGVESAVEGVVGMTHGAGMILKGAAGDINRQREQVGSHIAIASINSVRFVGSRFPFMDILVDRLGIASGNEVERLSSEERNEWDGGVHRRSFRGQQELRTSDSFMIDHEVPYSEVADEIGVITPPTMSSTHKLFSATVHLYLMLLLIVSFPGAHRTRLVIKRTGARDVLQGATKKRRKGFELSVQLAPVQEREGGRPGSANVKDEAAEETPTQSNMKKSLSYYI